jgi:heavy metal translocating P-type ATPase
VRQPKFVLERGGKQYRFCCHGCRQVFVMLSEAAQSGDPRQFKHSPLVDHCRALGLIPPRLDDPVKATAEPQVPDSDTPPAPPSDPSLEGTLSLVLDVQGMWCPACAWLIENSLERTPGIIQANCQFDLDRVRCRYDPIRIAPRQIAAAVVQLGYQPATPSAPAAARQRRLAWIRLALSGFLTMNVMMLSFALYSGFFSALDAPSVRYLSWPIFLMGTAVVFYGGYPIYRRALSGLRSAAFGMETLITLGVASAYGLSLHHFIKGGLHLYFDTAAMLVTLVLVGKYLEQRAKIRIRQGLDEFNNLRPAKVKLIPPGATRGRYTQVAQLGPQDLFEVGEGEVVPADGTVTQGQGRVDMSALTGEARPIKKGRGDAIISGARVLQGTFRVRAAREAQASVLGQMLEIMDRTLAQKTSLEGRTDKLLRGFVPVITLLAMSTAVFLYLRGLTPSTAWLRGVTVLVISCPCALGIAIPLARVAALGTALKQGFLVRDFACFEQVERIDTILFDKTGTLTRGQWALADLQILNSFGRSLILQWAAALEADADHPAAEHIRRAAQNETKSRGKPDRNPDVVEPEAQQVRIYDNGVTGVIGRHRIRLGSWQFIQEEPDASRSGRPWPSVPDPQALHSRIYMTVDGDPAALFVFDDDLRPTAAETVRQLTQRGLQVALISGDEARITRQVARRLGIDDFQGELSPQGKVAKVMALQQQGRSVAMVGDGINDAPAMAAAQVAFALGSTYDLGRQAAGVTLMTAAPERLIAFWNLAQRVNGKIYQNLVFSFVYNLLSIPIAMSGWLSPLVAVTAMLLSSLSVIGNTLGLLRAKPGAQAGPAPEGG